MFKGALGRWDSCDHDSVYTGFPMMGNNHPMALIFVCWRLWDFGGEGCRAGEQGEERGQSRA